MAFFIGRTVLLLLSLTLADIAGFVQINFVDLMGKIKHFLVPHVGPNWPQFSPTEYFITTNVHENKLGLCPLTVATSFYCFAPPPLDLGWALPLLWCFLRGTFPDLAASATTGDGVHLSKPLFTKRVLV